MSEIVIFKNVYKSYPHYHELTGGLKRFLFNFPRAVKKFNQMRFEALIDVNFSIKKGETVAIIGRNGAGKSTTLGLIAGVIKPSHGTVTINGRISPLLELGGGFHHELTGLENIRLNGVLLGMKRRQVEEKLEEIIEFSELGEFINRPVRTYSSGMKARLGFSVVAHLDPEILLIDEVLAVGDAKFREKCEKKILEFKDEGVTIILVSHSINDVLKLCERAIWLEDRVVKQIGSAQDVASSYCQELNVELPTLKKLK